MGCGKNRHNCPGCKKRCICRGERALDCGNLSCNTNISDITQLINPAAPQGSTLYEVQFLLNNALANALPMWSDNAINNINNWYANSCNTLAQFFNNCCTACPLFPVPCNGQACQQCFNCKNNINPPVVAEFNQHIMPFFGFVESLIVGDFYIFPCLPFNALSAFSNFYVLYKQYPLNPNPTINDVCNVWTNFLLFYCTFMTAISLRELVPPQGTNCNPNFPLLTMQNTLISLLNGNGAFVTSATSACGAGLPSITYDNATTWLTQYGSQLSSFLNSIPSDCLFNSGDVALGNAISGLASLINRTDPLLPGDTFNFYYTQLLSPFAYTGAQVQEDAGFIELANWTGSCAC